jgi:transcriptional regulator with XRE-family HTH domain
MFDPTCPTDPITPIADYLGKLRAQRNERQFDMARRLDLTSSHLYAIENGYLAMPSEVADQIIRGYGLTPEEAEAMKAAGAATRIRSCFDTA